MLKHLAYIIAGMFENAASAIRDRTGYHEMTDGEIMVSMEALIEMEILSSMTPANDWWK